MFVDRVLYGGPDEQRLALGALAGATAVGALASGFIVRVVRCGWSRSSGLVASVVALVAMSGWTTETPVGVAAVALAVFGLGFGATVTPRSTAAVAAVGRELYGMAASTVTVARMVGMAVGLAILTAYGSTTIDRLYDQVYATPDAYKAYIPASLQDRPLRDGLVIEALETWAAGEAGQIMVGVFLVAAVVTALAIPPVAPARSAAYARRDRARRHGRCRLGAERSHRPRCRKRRRPRAPASSAAPEGPPTGRRGPANADELLVRGCAWIDQSRASSRASMR